MGFKVGDKVKILNTEFGNKGKIGIIETISGTTMIYFVKLDGSCNSQWSNASDLELVTDEETTMKFKVGDKVRITWSCLTNKDKEGVISEDDGSVIPYKVTLDDGEVEWKHGNHITKLEEKVMKFKVGDKVKVSNSWEGRSGEVGEVTRVNDRYEFKYTITFDDGFEESFKEEELELVQQNFTKSDLKTGMGVVLRDGSKGHVLIATPTQDTIRFIEKDEWIGLDDYADDLTVKRFKNLDIIAVYKTKFENQYMTDRVFEQDLLYERKEEPTKMTMKEINEHFGKPIEIVE